MTFSAKTTAVPDDSGLEPPKSLLHLFRVVPLLKSLVARLAAGVQIRSSLLVYPSGVPRLGHTRMRKTGTSTLEVLRKSNKTKHSVSGQALRFFQF